MVVMILIIICLLIFSKPSTKIRTTQFKKSDVSIVCFSPLNEMVDIGRLVINEKEKFEKFQNIIKVMSCVNNMG